jgi:hypothetical protein
MGGVTEAAGGRFVIWKQQGLSFRTAVMSNQNYENHNPSWIRPVVTVELQSRMSLLGLGKRRNARHQIFAEFLPALN